jgi:CubicO group peptidase (beta-lactamase class C family)/putative intracellular protease/amidase
MSLQIILRALLGIFLVVCWSGRAAAFANTAGATANTKILIVTSNQHTYGNSSLNTANHFEEIVIAYDIFRKKGYQVDFVSPDGGAIPLGYIQTSNPIQKKYLYDAQFMNLLKNTFRPEQVRAGDYRAVYYSGGGAAMFGVAENTGLQNISSSIYESGGVVSAVCHGTAGIVNLKSRDGVPIFRNKNVTGFPDLFEDTKAEYYKTFPFSIDKEIARNGGNFVYAKQWGSDFHVVDGRLITGQDPNATASVAREVVKAIEGRQPAVAGYGADDAPLSLPAADHIFSELQAANTPAVAVALLHQGKLIYEKAYGNANLEYRIPATVDTRFQVDALAWEFIAYATLLLEQQGKLKLDDDIRRHLPELPELGATISINHLLSSTDGLPGYKVLNALAGWNLKGNEQDRVILGLIKRQKTLNFKPGTEFSPGGDTRLILLAKIVEAASGMSFDAYSQSQIFSPQGMPNTLFLYDNATRPDNTAVPYRKDAKGAYHVDTGNGEVPGPLNLYTSIRDLSTWRLALLSNEPRRKALAAKLSALIRLDNGTVIRDISSISNYAQQHVGKERGMPKLYQMGSSGGYASSMFGFPGHDVTVIVLSSGLAYNGSYGMRLASLLLEKHFPEPEKIDYSKINRVKLSAAELQRYAGHYWSPKRAIATEVQLKDGVLMYSRVGGTASRALIPLGGGAFQMVIEGDDHYRIDFVDRGNGRAMHFSMSGSDPVVFEAYQPVSYSEPALSEFTGTFYSDALDTGFVLAVQDGVLTAHNARAGAVALKPLKADLFAGDKGFMGGVTYRRDANNNVDGFEVNVDEVRHLKFRKLPTAAQ